MTRLAVTVLGLSVLLVAACGPSATEHGVSAAKGDTTTSSYVIAAQPMTLSAVGVVTWTVFERSDQRREVEGRDATGVHLMTLSHTPGSLEASFVLRDGPWKAGECSVDQEGAHAATDACDRMALAQSLFAADLEAAAGAGGSHESICDNTVSFRETVKKVARGGIGVACGGCALSIASLYFGWWGPSWGSLYLTCGSCAASLGIGVPTLDMLQECR